MTQQNRNTQAQIIAGVICLVALGGGLLWRAESRQNKVALASLPKPVTLVQAVATTYRPKRTYIGQMQPWIAAKVGPQYISGYVDTVLVRPGSVVKRGDVLATIDCRNPSAANRAIGMNARALDAREKALAHESARTQELLGGGFVSQNRAEQLAAESAAQQASLAATRAKLASSKYEVDDCVLRAPFDGEIDGRLKDPGAFVRPGEPIVTIMDRSIVRVAADAPVKDFPLIAPGTPVNIHAYALANAFKGAITRRTSAADVNARTIHLEIDLTNAEKSIPTNTTAEIDIELSETTPALALPLSTAAIRGKKATFFVVENDVAKSQTVEIIGEDGGNILVDPKFGATAKVVSEGRSLLENGDRVVTAPGGTR